MRSFLIEIDGKRLNELELTQREFKNCREYDLFLRDRHPGSTVTVNKADSSYFLMRYGDATPGSGAVLRLR